MAATCQIEAILDAIKGLSVTYDADVTIPCHGYDELTETLPAAGVPRRLLMVAGEGGVRSEDVAFVDIGTTMRIVWTIVDRLYLVPVTFGGGLRDQAHHMVVYCGAYINALRQLRGPTAVSNVLTATFHPGTFLWPDAAGGTEFFGVDVTLQIEEFIAGA